MTITIQIEGNLASILQTTAASRHQTANQLATQLLTDALSNQNHPWAMRNQRRIDLIRQGNRRELSAAESEELQQLQDEADRLLEAGDRLLLDQLSNFRTDIEKLPVTGSAPP